MRSLILRHLARLALVLAGMATVAFIIARVLPADPAVLAAGLNPNRERVARIRREMGLDRPLAEQYTRFMRDLVLRGDLGRSTLSQRPVTDDLRVVLPATLELVLVTFVVCAPLGIALALFTARRDGRGAATAARLFTGLGVAMPVFTLGLIFQLVFYRNLGWLPPGGRLNLNIIPPRPVTGLLLVDCLLQGNWPALRSGLQHMVLPAVALGIAALPVIALGTRRTLAAALSSGFVHAARAKGLPEGRGVVRHALRAALSPTAAILWRQVAALAPAVFLVEIIFSWPGVGLYTLRAIAGRDFPAIVAVTLSLSMLYAALGLVTDLGRFALDPRRLSRDG
jgi:peptide/nickel transport system permease protein